MNNSSKGQILRALENCKGQFDIPRMLETSRSLSVNTLMSRIERVDEKYEKSLGCDNYERLLHGKNDEKSQDG